MAQTMVAPLPKPCVHCEGRGWHNWDCPLTVLGDFARVLAVVDLALAVQVYGDAREARGARVVFAAINKGER